MTFHLFKDYLKIPSGEYEKTADRVEEKMIETADSVIFSSEWAKDSAITHYHAEEVFVIIPPHCRF